MWLPGRQRQLVFNDSHPAGTCKLAGIAHELRQPAMHSSAAVLVEDVLSSSFDAAGLLTRPLCQLLSRRMPGRQRQHELWPTACVSCCAAHG